MGGEAIMTQCERILRHLRDYGSITLRTGATAEGKRRQRRAGIQRMRPGWSRLREGAAARLL